MNYKQYQQYRIRSLAKDKIAFQRDRKGVARLLGTQRAIPHLLEFLRGTKIRLRQGELTRRRKWEEQQNQEDKED